MRHSKKCETETFRCPAPPPPENRFWENSGCLEPSPFGHLTTSIGRLNSKYERWNEEIKACKKRLNKKNTHKLITPGNPRRPLPTGHTMTIRNHHPSLSACLGLTGLIVFPSPPPEHSLKALVRAEWGLLSLLRRPDSPASTPLSSLRVCPPSDS